jgi:protein-S-isoprenylcysteine O-methyltransferase Ste14
MGSPRKTRPQRSRQNLVLVVPLLVLLLFRLGTRAQDLPAWATALLTATGLALLLLGVTVRVLARQWKAERAHSGLVTDGLYGYVRNPLYAGSFLLGLGLTLMLGDWLIIVAFLAAFAWNHGAVMRAEERKLERIFGEPYRQYRATVPALLPKLAWVRRRIRPDRAYEAIVREADSICLWLIVPLLVPLLLSWVKDPRNLELDGSMTLNLVGAAALAVLWVRWKADYRALAQSDRPAVESRMRIPRPSGEPGGAG